MANLESMREFVSGPVDAELYRQRIAEGWRLVAVEWQRETAATEGGGADTLQDVPFGLRIASDCVHLEEDPVEKRVLLLVLGLIVKDAPLADIAEELNRNGLRTRGGLPWTRTSVFDLHPRLIEAFPRLLASKEWDERRRPQPLAG